MTDPRDFIEHVDQVLEQCDAAKLPPLIKLTRDQAEAYRQVDDRPHTWAPGGFINPLYSVPVRFVDTVEESTPYQLLNGGPAFDPPVDEQACCDLHNQNCELPENTCCDNCPRTVELAQLVAEHTQATERERQALVGGVIDEAADQHAAWWRRILGLRQ